MADLHPALEAIVQALDHNLDMDEMLPTTRREQITQAVPDFLHALEVAGWAIVPVEPTNEVLRLGMETNGTLFKYHSMVQAGKVRL